MKRMQQGVALIMVLWVLTLMIIMAGSFTLTMQREIKAIGYLRDNAQAMAIAEAGVAIAQLNLLHQNQYERWRADGSLYQAEFAGAKIRVKIQSESGKVDINRAKNELLAGLIEQTDIDQTLRPAIVAAIKDWRDADDNVNINGAEKKDYHGAGLPYEPRNKYFQNIDELKLVLGVSAALFAQLEPLITVHSRQKGIDVNTAPAKVLAAASGLDSASIEDYMLARLEHNRNKQPPPQFPGGNLQKTKMAQVYTILSEARLESGAKAAVQVTVKKKGGKQAFTSINWKRKYMAGKASLFSAAMDSWVVNQDAEPELEN